MTSSLSLQDIAKRLHWDGEVSLSAFNRLRQTMLIHVIEASGMDELRTDALELVPALLALGADPNLYDEADPAAWMPLEHATHSSELVQILLKAGVNQAHSKSHGPILYRLMNELYDVYTTGYLQTNNQDFSRITTVSDVLKTFQLLVDAGFRFDFSRSHVYQIRQVLETLIAVHAPSSFIPILEKAGLVLKPFFEVYGKSIEWDLLFQSVSHQNEDMLDYLIKFGFSTSSKSDGTSILHYWTAQTMLRPNYPSKMFEVLCNNQVDWNVENLEGQTPLFGLFLPMSMVAKMIELGANLEHRDRFGRTPFLDLCRYEDFSWDSLQGQNYQTWVSKMNLLSVDNEGNGALHFATSPLLIEDLLQRGLSPTRKNLDGETPVMYHLRHHHRQAAALIEKYLLQRLQTTTQPHVASRI